MTSAISYYYYIVVAIPFILSLHNASNSSLDSANGVQKQSQDTSNTKINFALWFASILTLVQFPILGIAQEGDQIITTAGLIGGVLISCYLYIVAVLVRSTEKSKRPQERNQ
jgi:hypothetical protein